MKQYIVYLLLVLLAGATASCKKFLDEKPDKKLVIPATLTDCQALLDNYFNINNKDAGSGEASSDNYYLTEADWASLPQDYNRRLYLWQKDSIFQPTSLNDWGILYAVVYTANTVLETIDDIPRTAANAPVWDDVKGQALFHRGRSFFTAATLWCPAYDQATVAADMGVPLRLGTDFNVPSVRASAQETWQQVIGDLTQAIPLLPVTTVHVVRPTKAAAYGMLSRVYLAMRQYDKAGRYADSCLQLSGGLLNYNTLSAAAVYPVPQFNIEVVFDSRMILPASINPTKAKIDSVLYQSYAANDLRKTIFFKSNNDGTYAFRGLYTGSVVHFSGVTTSEVYLNRAECFARAGNTTAAMNDLNILLANRWKTGTFPQLTASTPQEALDKILAERRKELVYRNLRWIDLKRLNKEGYNITLKRILYNQVYTLPPNDPRYALALPENVLELTGMPQNPR